MTTTHQSADRLLLFPVPRELCIHPGVCSLRQKFSLELRADDARLSRALNRWLKEAILDAGPFGNGPDLHLAIVADPVGLSGPDAYHLSVRQDCITIAGATPAACFHGLQTLRQLRHPDRHALPCCDVRDWPDFRTRGLLHDVTRGKVPTLATLKSLADRLASLKVNQLQLYIEHAFTFAFDTDIAGPDDALTPDEIRELDAYCRDRFIDLVPAVATLGHMGRILSMPRYRHLAEIEPTREWSDLTWPERARGFTLDVLNPESHRLVERVWSEILDAFSSPIVNICGDEPWDLGKGKNRERFAAGGVGEAYIGHILRTHAICAARGRRTQVWSDVVHNHPELFDRLPRDLTVLHWGYDDRADYEGTRRFVEAGLDTIVCPGTSGWKRILNAMNLAERNIAVFAAAGKRWGASGLLNTDWGDHGHFNALACSWHAIALGAALAWRADHPTGPDFDRRFAHTAVGRALPADLVALLRDASRIADRCETWRLLWQPIAQVRNDPTLPSIDDADCAAESARGAIGLLKSILPNAFADPRDRDELLVACEFTGLFAEKVRILRAAGLLRAADFSPRGDSSAGPATDGLQSRLVGSPHDPGAVSITKSPNHQIAKSNMSPLAPSSLNDRLSAAAQSFASCWRARNKPSGLRDILTALDCVRADLSAFRANS